MWYKVLFVEFNSREWVRRWSISCCSSIFQCYLPSYRISNYAYKGPLERAWSEGIWWCGPTSRCHMYVGPTFNLKERVSFCIKKGTWLVILKDETLNFILGMSKGKITVFWLPHMHIVHWEATDYCMYERMVLLMTDLWLVIMEDKHLTSRGNAGCRWTI